MQDLPKLFDRPTAGPIPDASREVIGALNEMTEQQRLSREGAELQAQEAKHKTIGGHYGAATTTLHRLCHVGRDEDLPGIYNVVAKATKTNLRSAIQRHLDDVADSLGLAGFSPIVTSDLAQRISQANFLHVNVDDLTVGVHPFVLGYPTSVYEAHLRDQAAKVDMAMGGGTQLTLTEIERLGSSTKVHVTVSLLQGEGQIKRMTVLVVGLLGSVHPVVREWRAFAQLYDQKKIHLEALVGLIPFGPAKILRYGQIRWSHWFNDQSRTAGRLIAPKFSMVLAEIQNLSLHWAPPIPDKYLPKAKEVPSGNPGGAPKFPSEKPGGPPPPGSERVTPEAGASKRVSNPDYDSKYDTFKGKFANLTKMREAAAAAGHPIPKNDDGIEICLSYHEEGFCWENCKRKKDHKKHSAAEDERHHQWCQVVHGLA